MMLTGNKNIAVKSRKKKSRQCFKHCLLYAVNSKFFIIR